MFSLIQVFFIRVFSLVFCLLYQHFESTLIKGGLLKLFQRKKIIPRLNWNRINHFWRIEVWVFQDGKNRTLKGKQWKRRKISYFCWNTSESKDQKRNKVKSETKLCILSPKISSLIEYECLYRFSFKINTVSEISA